MSYSFGTSPGPARELRERAEQVAAAAKVNWPAEADRDIAAAIDAAVQLAKSLTEGDSELEVYASISGHANTDRNPPPGWSPDSVYVSVGRVRAPEPTEPEAAP